MLRDTTDPPTPPAWLVDWMREASSHRQCHSLVLGSSSWPGLEELAAAVAAYLNEFDSDGGCQWRTFGTDLLRSLAGNPASRDIVLAGANPVTNLPPQRPDLDRVARRLARIGGVVLVGPAGLSATSDLSETFRVCLSTGDSVDLRDFHLWVNPERYSFHGLTSVIADSFLDWSCHDSAAAGYQPEAPSSPPTRPFGPDLPG